MQNGFRLALLAAIVAVVLLVLAATVGIYLVDHDGDSTPLISSILGFGATILASLFALFYASKVEKKVNGRIDRIVDEIDTELHDAEQRPPA